MTDARSRSSGPSRIAVVGCGAIGRATLALLRDDPRLDVVRVVVPERSVAAVAGAARSLAPNARVGCTIDLGDSPVDLVVECAGHAALARHVVPALAAGVPAIVASIGALHDDALAARLEDAARAGGTRVTPIAGAVGAIDALAAARIGGLDVVAYVGRKPPAGWRGTEAERVCDLDAIVAPTVLFEGSAREAARRYPKNANVAATVSLAGVGLDATRVTLVADPGVTRNVHRIVAEGAFGRLDATVENAPLPDNPRTSALTVWSLVRAIRAGVSPMSL